MSLVEILKERKIPFEKTDDYTTVRMNGWEIHIGCSHDFTNDTNRVIHLRNNDDEEMFLEILENGNTDNVAVLHDNFCPLPWIHLYIDTRSMVNLCCVSDWKCTVGDTKKDTLSHIWNNPKMQEIRGLFLNGSYPENCKNCIENRNEWGREFRKTVLKHDTLRLLTKRVGTEVGTENITRLDIRFSNMCNMACRTCNSLNSHKLTEENDEFYGNTDNKTRLVKITPETFDEVMGILPTVESIYFAGGEPLIMKEHYDIMDWLIRNRPYEVDLSYNTNCSKLKYGKHDVVDMWKQQKHVYVGISIDAYGKRAEYVRYGIRYDDVEKNILRLFDEFSPVNERVVLVAHVTVSVFNVMVIDEIVKHFENIGFVRDRIRLSPAYHPHFISVAVLNDEMRNEAMNRLEKVGDLFGAEDVKRLVENAESNDNILEGFRRWVEITDRHRGQNIVNHCPELEILLK